MVTEPSEEAGLSAAELALLGWISRWPASNADLHCQFRRTMSPELKTRLARLIAKGCIRRIDRRWWLTADGARHLYDQGISVRCTEDLLKLPIPY